MKTYWFTVAAGDHYLRDFRDLNNTAGIHGIEIVRLGDGVPVAPDAFEARDYESFKKAKKLKIEGILGAPDGHDRVVFIDADTLLVDPSGMDGVSGALREPWGMGNVPQVAVEGGEEAVRRREDRLWAILRKAGLDEFCPDGRHHRQEWNSGVIAGDRKFMEELAREWAFWWEVVLDACDGYFRRDQISFKYAYAKIARGRHGFETIPGVYNCCVKRMGFPRNAKILHKAGRPGPRILRKWEKAKKLILRRQYGRLWLW